MNDIKIGLGDNSSWSIFVPPQPEKPPSIPDKVEFKKTTIDSGFGCDDKLTINCPKPQLHTHLCKENYLGEFKEESEKALARDNLGVYSKDEINKVLEDAVANLDTSIFITKKKYIIQLRIQILLTLLLKQTQIMKFLNNYLIYDRNQKTISTR